MAQIQAVHDWCELCMSGAGIWHKCQLPAMPPAPWLPAHSPAFCSPPVWECLPAEISAKLDQWNSLFPSSCSSTGKPAHIHVPAYLLLNVRNVIYSLFWHSQAGARGIFQQSRCNPSYTICGANISSYLTNLEGQQIPFAEQLLWYVGQIKKFSSVASQTSLGRRVPYLACYISQCLFSGLSNWKLNKQSPCLYSIFTPLFYNSIYTAQLLWVILMTWTSMSQYTEWK